MYKLQPVNFKCANCDALYQLIKAEAGPETNSDREIPCAVCGGMLPAREGEFVRKYFLLRKAARRRAVIGCPGQTGQGSFAALSQTVKTKSSFGAAGAENSFQLFDRKPDTS